ncbi:hypothetical protein EA250_27385 [Escherichia coli]|nr:hypothetical protein EA250_27385 [Escherichia coli]
MFQTKQCVQQCLMKTLIGLFMKTRVCLVKHLVASMEFSVLKTEQIYSGIIFSTSENMVSGICYGFVVSVVLFIKVISHCHNHTIITLC